MTITKERFLLVRCTPLGEQKLPAAAQVVQASIRDSVQENFGDFGVGCILTLLQVRHYSSDTGLLLVRVAACVAHFDFYAEVGSEPPHRGDPPHPCPFFLSAAAALVADRAA